MSERITDPLRYFVPRPGRGGTTRYFWQPGPSMRAKGMKPTRLSDDIVEAHTECSALNGKWDKIRLSHKGDRRDEVSNAGEEKKIWTSADVLSEELFNLGLTFIYVIGSDDGSQKIGITVRPLKRLGALQHASPTVIKFQFLASIPHDPRRVEAIAHASLFRFHQRGEWFRCTPTVAIKAVLAALDPKHQVNAVSAPDLRRSDAATMLNGTAG